MANWCRVVSNVDFGTTREMWDGGGRDCLARCQMTTPSKLTKVALRFLDYIIRPTTRPTFQRLTQYRSPVSLSHGFFRALSTGSCHEYQLTQDILEIHFQNKHVFLSGRFAWLVRNKVVDSISNIRARKEDMRLFSTGQFSYETKLHKLGVSL